MAGVTCGRSFKRPRLDESDFYEDSSCASEESCYDWQGYETAWVQDSGDDWSPSSSSGSDGDATDVIYEVEYEIASDSDSDLDDEESDGSSDIEAALIPIIAAELEDESLTGIIESSDDGILRNSPIPFPKNLEDRWKCLQCGVLNVPPMRYCSKCYDIRKGWLDPRPKRRRPKRNHDENRSTDTIPATSSVSSTSSSATSQGDSVVSTRTVDSGISSQGSCEEEVVASSSGEQKQPCSCSDLCGLCGLRPIDAAFIHGRTGHQLYCYSCSNRIWRERKKCPVCRRTIGKVARMFRGTSS